MRKHFYNKKTIKIGDMRVDFYTYEHCECRAKRGARRERTMFSKNQSKTWFSIESGA